MSESVQRWARRARTTDSGRYCSVRSPSISPIGMVSIRVRSKPSAPHQASMRSSSSSFTPLSATALILTCSPACFAASIPASTFSYLPQRVMARKRSGSSVSSETLIRRTPACTSASRMALELAAVGGHGQLVQPARAHVPAELADQPHDVAPDQGLAAGEPDLAHAEIDEGRGQPVELLQGEQLGLGQEGHLLGHAVDAAEIAAVGDRQPDVGDLPSERIAHPGPSPHPACRSEPAAHASCS